MIAHYLRMLDPRYVYRSSITGQFVGRAYALMHPHITQRERVDG